MTGLTYCKYTHFIQIAHVKREWPWYRVDGIDLETLKENHTNIIFQKNEFGFLIWFQNLKKWLVNCQFNYHIEEGWLISAILCKKMTRNAKISNFLMIFYKNVNNFFRGLPSQSNLGLALVFMTQYCKNSNLPIMHRVGWQSEFNVSPINKTTRLTL